MIAFDQIQSYRNPLPEVVGFYMTEERMTRECHARFGSGDGVGDRPADHNLGPMPMISLVFNLWEVIKLNPAKIAKSPFHVCLLFRQWIGPTETGLNIVNSTQPYFPVDKHI
jgi:hypothetical protein